MIERACQIAEAQSTKLSPKRVMVIATRYDEVNNPEDRVREFNERLLKLHQEYEDVLVPNDKSVIFPINAMSTGAEREKYTSQLQKCLIDIVRRSIKPVKVPLKWFVYELDLDEESEKTCGVVKKSKCIELGKHLGMETTDIEHSLQFFSELALHLYHPGDDDFPDLVLIKMDPLTDRLSALIRTSFYPPRHIITKQCSVLKERGIFHEPFLDVAFKGITDQAISNHCFLQITQCLKVIVSVGDGRYFIPSALSVDKHQQIDKLSQHVPCAFNLKECSILPPGFFCTLIVMLLSKTDSEGSHFSLRENVCQSRDQIVLDVEVIGGNLTLTNEDEQIWLTYKCEGSSSQDYIDVIKLVVQTLNKVVNNFFSKKTIAVSPLEVCFPCPDCVTLHPCQQKRQHNLCAVTSSKHPLTDEMINIVNSVNSSRDTEEASTSTAVTGVQSLTGTLPSLPSSCYDNRKRTLEDRDMSSNDKYPLPQKRKEMYREDQLSTDVLESLIAKVDDTLLTISSDLIAVLRVITSVVKWHSLGLELPGLEKCQLDRIEIDNRGIVEDCQKAMVSEWLHTGVATWRGLVQALASPLVNRRDLTLEIAKQHQI